MTDCDNLNDYLQRYGRSLAEGIKERAEPLYRPGQDWDPRLYDLLKQPYQAQGDAVMGLSEALKTHDSALCVGEMGCGKTLVGLSVPYVHNPPGKASRTLVMCPSHLVNKWVREAYETVPDVEASIIDGLEDVTGLDPDVEVKRAEYLVVSKERAKLGYAWEPAVWERRGQYACPTCGESVVDQDGIPVEYDYLERSKRWCSECDGALWQADNSRFRRYPIAEYVKNYLPGYFDFFVADEIHELKGGHTAQGNAFGALAASCGRTVGLTGTLLGGYADDVYFILHRLSPAELKAEGLEYGEVSKWMSRYGVLERITKYYPEDNVYSKGKKGGTRVKRKPGVSPVIFSKHLLDKTVFLQLEDVADDLPALEEEVIGVDMDEELAEAYGRLETELSAEVSRALAQGDHSLLGTYINTLMSYPDRPFGYETLIHPHSEEVIAEPAELRQDRRYNKEEKLLQIVQESLSEGRAIFVYAQYTGKRDVTTRLQDLLTDEGIRAEVLRSSVSPVDREEWLSEKIDDGVQAVLGNPRLVQTGLDLISFPSLAFYQTGYSIYTLRQASRRSWRIGQEQDVKVHYLYYRPTMQERAMRLMGSKLNASLAIEGRFSQEGLLAMTQGEDMTTAMARALVDGLEGEGVEELWSRLGSGETERAYPEAFAEGKLFDVDAIGEEGGKRTYRRRRKPGEGEQLSLLSWGGQRW